MAQPGLVYKSHIEYRSSYVVLLHLEWGCLCVLYKNGCFYINYTKLSDLWCEYMEYIRSVIFICLLGYDIMNVISYILNMDMLINE